MIEKKKILVPTDFTKVGDTALNHALEVSTAIGADVYVLHIIEDKRHLSEARMKLDALAARTKNETGRHIETLCRIGNIYDDIDSVGNELDAVLIIMGTHGLRGMQFITGSRALRIVTDSSIPFIITQERGIRANGYDVIVTPLDLHKETKQKLGIVADMAKYFNSHIHLVSPGETDEFLKNQLDRNINYAKDFLTERDVKFEVHITGTKSGKFVKDVVKYAVSVNADLIAIMNLYENSLFQIIGGSYEQDIITNDAQIPVLCVNPVQTTVMNKSVFAS
jgi:nucleotide-binding universal stress UspA family protein